MKRNVVLFLILLAQLLVIGFIVWRFIETKTLIALRDALIIAVLGTGVYVLFEVLKRHFKEPPF